MKDYHFQMKVSRKDLWYFVVRATSEEDAREKAVRGETLHSPSWIRCGSTLTNEVDQLLEVREVVS